MRTVLLTLLLVGACSSSGEDASAPDAAVAADVPVEVTADIPPVPRPFVVVTFNTGSGPELPHDGPPDDGYGDAEAALTDTWYGNGLAWEPFVEATRAFFGEIQPDVVVFQEIFWSGECPSIPAEAQAGFVCETWAAGEPTVAQRVLGDGWQVACHPGKPDKCAAVHERFGRFAGCDADLCLEGMTGFTVEGCGSGARVARVVIERNAGGPITLVGFHGSSGLTEEDFACRVQQVEQVFVDLGDGAPGANGGMNLIMGDLNTDPGLLAGADPSADRWNDFAGEAADFHFVTDASPDAPKSYANLFNIDHVVSDAFEGACWIAGLTEGHPPVMDAVFFDHKPVVCTLQP